MLYSSLMLLDTGVPVMNAMLLPCPASRSHSHLSSRSSHFAADDNCMPRSAEATGTPRFLKWWASSTMSMSTPSDSNSMPASALSSRDSLPSRRRCMAVSALLRAASSRVHGAGSPGIRRPRRLSSRRLRRVHGVVAPRRGPPLSRIRAPVPPSCRPAAAPPREGRTGPAARIRPRPSASRIGVFSPWFSPFL